MESHLCPSSFLRYVLHTGYSTCSWYWRLALDTEHTKPNRHKKLLTRHTKLSLCSVFNYSSSPGHRELMPKSKQWKRAVWIRTQWYRAVYNAGETRGYDRMNMQLRQLLLLPLILLGQQKPLIRGVRVLINYAHTQQAREKCENRMRKDRCKWTILECCLCINEG